MTSSLFGMMQIPVAVFILPIALLVLLVVGAVALLATLIRRPGSPPKTSHPEQVHGWERRRGSLPPVQTRSHLHGQTNDAD